MYLVNSSDICRDINRNDMLGKIKIRYNLPAQCPSNKAIKAATYFLPSLKKYLECCTLKRTL